MLQNSPTSTFNFKKNPGVILPDGRNPVKRGRGRGEEKERRGREQGRGGPQFTFLATPLRENTVYNSSTAS